MAGLPEGAPLVKDNEEKEGDSNCVVNNKNGRRKHVDMPVFWKFFCLLAGQYIDYERSPKWKCFSVFGLFFNSLCAQDMLALSW